MVLYNFNSFTVKNFSSFNANTNNSRSKFFTVSKKINSYSNYKKEQLAFKLKLKTVKIEKL